MTAVASGTVVQSAITNPSIGDAINLHASVLGTDPVNVPTGNIAFKDGSTTIATVASTSSGQFLAHAIARGIIFTTGGDHSITAVYAGDANNATSTSPAVIVRVSTTPVDPNVVSSSQLSVQLADEATQEAANVALGTDAFGDGRD